MAWDFIIKGIRPYFSASDEQIKKEVRKLDKEGGFLGAKFNGKLAAFALVAWPESALDVPQVLHFYSEGPRNVTRLLVGHVLDTVKKKGYTTLRAINGSAMSDEVWTRTFRHEGWEIKPVKTVFDFEAVQ